MHCNLRHKLLLQGPHDLPQMLFLFLQALAFHFQLVVSPAHMAQAFRYRLHFVCRTTTTRCGRMRACVHELGAQTLTFVTKLMDACTSLVSWTRRRQLDTSSIFLFGSSNSSRCSIFLFGSSSSSRCSIFLFGSSSSSSSSIDICSAQLFHVFLRDERLAENRPFAVVDHDAAL